MSWGKVVVGSTVPGLPMCLNIGLVQACLPYAVGVRRVRDVPVTTSKQAELSPPVAWSLVAFPFHDAVGDSLLVLPALLQGLIGDCEPCRTINRMLLIDSHCQRSKILVFLTAVIVVLSRNSLTFIPLGPATVQLILAVMYHNVMRYLHMWCPEVSADIST